MKNPTPFETSRAGRNLAPDLTSVAELQEFSDLSLLTLDGTAPPERLGSTTSSVESEHAVRTINLGKIGTDHLVSSEIAKNSGEIDRGKEIYRLSRNPDTYEVTVESYVTLENYEQITPPEDWALLKKWAVPMKGKTVVFLNPTMEGGGVAMLRPPLVHLLRLLGVDARWYVLQDIKDPAAGNPFLFTKLMHNIAQRRTAPEVRITPEGKALHQQWNAENAEVLERQEPIRTADIIVYDDPQPAPLIPRLKEINPTAKTVWRNHIDTSGVLMADPTTPQGELASYLLDECGVRHVDAVVTHPEEAFVHPDMSDKTFFAPATTEPHDDLNRPLSEIEIQNGFDFINEEIALKNLELAADGRMEDIQALMDPNKRRITLIARFDESKGMDKAMELGVQTRQEMREAGVPEEDLPEVVIVGNGSIDDPSGIPMYNETLRLRREKYPDDMQSIIIMRLKHNYTAMNALMCRSDVITQTSEAEGWETRVSDAIEHGVPVVVSNRGGIKKQVVEGESGFVLDFDKPGYDLERGAEIICELLTNPYKYHVMKQSTLHQAHTFNRREITTTANVTRFLRIFNSTLEGSETSSDRIWMIRDMVTAERSRQEQLHQTIGKIAA